MIPPANVDLESDNPLFQSIIFSIGNFEPLSSIQIHYLYLCSKDNLIQIIKHYNGVLDYMIYVFMLDD